MYEARSNNSLNHALEKRKNKTCKQMDETIDFPHWRVKRLIICGLNCDAQAT
jgi:hypothetical protein